MPSVTNVTRNVFLAIVVLIVPNQLLGQGFAGRVINDFDGAPVGRGFVVLLDANRVVISRTLTRSDGRFDVAIPSNMVGPFRLRSERIGFQSVTTEDLPVDGPTNNNVVIRVRPIAMSLSAIEVRGSTECDVRGTRDRATSVAWEEARKALAAAAWTESQPYDLVSNVYEKDFDFRRGDLVSETHRRSLGFSRPFRAPDPNVLKEQGYLAENDHTVTYFAPDAEVLQHDTFLETHCFQLRESDDGLLGLTFAPVPSRRLPEVTGTLWLDRATSELQFLEFEYTDLPAQLRTREPGKGRLDFLRLPTGAWIVRSWEIEIPTVVRRVGADRGAADAMVSVQSVRRAGGEVMSITDSSGTVIHRPTLSVVRGTVIDSLLRNPTPLAGAVVSVENTWFADTADAAGQFELSAPLEGEYTLRFTHPRLDSLALESAPTTAIFSRMQPHVVTLAATQRSLRRSHDERCQTDRRYGNKILTGVVRDSARSTPRARVQVVATWLHLNAGTTLEGLQWAKYEATTFTDSLGRYVLCGLEDGRPAQVYLLGVDGELSTPMRVAFEDGGVSIGDTYQIAEHGVGYSDRTLGSMGSRRVVSGVATDLATGDAISEAVVSVFGTPQSVRADRHGAIRLQGLEVGTHRLIVSALGYRSRVVEVQVTNDLATFLGPELILEPVPQARGVVTQMTSGMPLTRANVTLRSMNGDPMVQTYTDSLGRFLITAPTEGTYVIEARVIGYTPARVQVTLSGGAAFDADLSLEGRAFSLDPIEVTAEAVDAYLTDVGFHQRQRAGNGYFMDPKAIEERLGVSHDATDLFAHLPGVNVGRDQPGRTGAPVDLRRGWTTMGGTCSEPVFFVNGVRLDPMVIGQAFMTLSSVVQPSDIYAIEVYRSPSQVPMQFGGPESLCGVILIWTR